MDQPAEFVPLENYPELTKKVPCILGIDEAGRGPVLGPLVYSIFICPLEHQGVLKELGVADSKVLDVVRREKFAKVVSDDYRDKLGWSVKVVTPQTISHSMQMCNKYNLNSLSFDTVYSILDRIKAQGVIVDHVFVDTLGKPETYKKQLSDRYPSYSFTVCSKADSIYPVVGAASIFAKVTRDFNLENWTPSGSSLSFDRNFGSGYPSDPNTVNWLKRNMNKVFGFPEIVRFSWSSCSRILEESAFPVNWNDPIISFEESSGKKRSAPGAANLKQTSFNARGGEKKENNFLSAYKCKRRWMVGWSTNYSANKQMEEFIGNKKKVLKIENPISLFTNLFSIGAENRTEKWQSLNTLMVINNHKRIDILEEQLSEEQARVRYLEDFSEQLDGKVGGLERSMSKVKKEISSQKKSLMTILMIVKLINGHESNKKKGMMGAFASGILQNAAIFAIIQAIMRITFLDQVIETLLGLLLRFGNRRTMERSRFMIKLSLTLALFFMLKERIRNLLGRLRSAISCFNI